MTLFTASETKRSSWFVPWVGLDQKWGKSKQARRSLFLAHQFGQIVKSLMSMWWGFKLSMVAILYFSAFSPFTCKIAFWQLVHFELVYHRVINKLVKGNNIRSFLDNVDKHTEQYNANILDKLNELSSLYLLLIHSIVENFSCTQLSCAISYNTLLLKRRLHGSSKMVVLWSWSKQLKPGFSREKKNEPRERRWSSPLYQCYFIFIVCRRCLMN